MVRNVKDKIVNKSITVLYAHRNRDVERIKLSLDSLKYQILQNFEVVLVDYGSEASLEEELENLSANYPFVRYYHLPVPQLLWNKCKALNFGIKKAEGAYIFIADIDLFFHPETTSVWQELKNPKKFYLFELGYLDKRQSSKLVRNSDFEQLKPSRFGSVNGMVLTSKESLIKVNGLDEFFHFYGAEDEDLFARLENAGYKREQRKEELFMHMWHQSFAGTEDGFFTAHPRIRNIMRINNRHYQSNKEGEVVLPLRQQKMGITIDPNRAKSLKKPDATFKIGNFHNVVEHFLREELPSKKGKIVRVEFFEDPYFTSTKFKIKKLLGKETIPYISMKEVNDMVLKEILYNYRDYNYSFCIQNNLKIIVFTIEL